MASIVFIVCFLILSISQPGNSQHSEEENPDYGTWEKNLVKFLYGARRMYDTHPNSTKKDPTRYKKFKHPTKPWALLDQPCDLDKWNALIRHFVEKGDDPYLFLESLKDKKTAELNAICMNEANDIPVLMCADRGAGMTPTCECLHREDEEKPDKYTGKPFKKRYVNTPFDYLRPNDGKDTTAKECFAEEGSNCSKDKALGLRCKREDFFQCNLFNLCGANTILFTDAMINGVRDGIEYTNLVNSIGIIDLSQNPDAGNLFVALLSVAHHPVETGHNGCNLDMYDKVAGGVIKLLAKLKFKDNPPTTLDPGFPEAYEDFINKGGLKKSLDEYEILTGMVMNEKHPMQKQAALTSLCLDSFPAARCVDTKSAETTQSTDPTSERYLLDGDCICSNHKNQKIITPLFNFTHYTGKSNEGHDVYQCRPTLGVPCASVSSALPCAATPEQTCLPPGQTSFKPQPDAIPHIFFPYEFLVCTELPRTPKPNKTIIKGTGGVGGIKLANVFNMLMIWTLGKALISSFSRD